MEAMEGTFALVALLALVALGAWIAAISVLVDIAKQKGHYADGAGVLWFIGIFATPTVVGLIVAALPDRGVGSPAQAGVGGPASFGDLPDL